MYGLLIVGVQHFIETYYGQHVWPLVVARAGLTTLDYQTQKIYSETIIERLMVALSQETGRSVEELRYQNGLSFAAFTVEYGYEKLLRVQGRSFIHLLRNLDNLHEHLRFSYPKIRPPSFFTVTETVDSIKLVYSSKRVGYEHYVRGQLVNLAKRFFNLNITVTLISRRMEGLVHHVMYEITHDGKTWGLPGGDYTQTTLPTWSPTLHSDEFFGVVSFFILITPTMIIQRASESFNRFDNELEGSVFSEKFLIGRPYINATFEEGLKQYLTKAFSEELWWSAILHVTGKRKVIQTRQIYPESLLPRLVSYVSEITDLSEDDIFFEYGCFFTHYLTDSGYYSLLRVIGEGFPQFMNELDDLHYHLQFSYPRIKPPSFVVAEMTDTTMIIVYVSKRNSFPQFVRGQLTAIAALLYDLDVEVEITDCVKELTTHKYIYRITNKGGEWPKGKCKDIDKTQHDSSASLHICSQPFFRLFRFHLLFTENLYITSVGEGYNQFGAVVVEKLLTDIFFLHRPKIDLTFSEIKLHRHNTFELVLVSDVNLQKNAGRGVSLSQAACKFKGQMCYIEEWNMILFLGTPVLRDTKQLADCGLYISDLNLFDRSRDIILSGDQQSDELMKLFKKQLEESKQLEKSMKRVEKMRKITDELLYQCIPKGVAQKLRSGTPALETIQTFESVSVCFTKVVNFGAKCMQISVEEVIQLLNNMYTIFDALTESHKVYKVETVGDSYMLVSGAPQRTPMHAAHITEMAMEMIVATQHGLSWPQTAQKSANERRHSLTEHVQLFVGCNTGPIVAGVVGYKTPRYCLFGDTVNTASRMMSTGVPDKIHVSNSFAEALSKYPYIVELRGKTVVKGKGEMETYFVCGHDQNFTFVDEVSGERRRFDEILKEDFQCSCQTPTESSLSHGSASVDLTDEASEDEQKGDAFSSACSTPTRKDSDKADGTLVRKIKVPLLQLQKAQSTDRTETEVEGIVIDSTPDEILSNGAAVGRTRKTGLVGLDAEHLSLINPHREAANTETNKVLNGVAHKLLISKSNEVRQKKVMRLPDVTFSAEIPSEIPNNPYEAEVSRSENESDAGLIDPSEDSIESPHSGSIKTRSHTIPNGIEGRRLNGTPPPSPRNSAGKSYVNGLGNAIRTEDYLYGDKPVWPYTKQYEIAKYN
ncbi:heme NO binding protein [Opisthorchis viverrini]|uniref:guanylate cyclase n=1 Tax=Opisthorchis viverrini TaxID=6198 RepID=A0A1S8X7N9_OPIVI|nr:heme NO binding protein [Opisthorchis viverrini]